MFDQSAISEIILEANKAGIRPSSVLAVAETESAGKVYAFVKGVNEPLIRWEGHYFHRRLKGDALARAVREGLASPVTGDVKNPKEQAARYALLEHAAQINREAAYESASWGLGQVMGANWKDLGYKSAADLVADARSGVAGQVRVMIRFIVKNGLVKALNGLDFAAFALRYNGKGYAANKYDVKMASAEKRWAKQGVNLLRPAPQPSVQRVPVSGAHDAPAPAPKPKSFIGAALAGLLAWLAGMALAFQCSLPQWVIDWFDYAAKCVQP